MHRIIALIGKAFVLASVAAVMLPMPKFARGLSGDQYVVWLARLVWVLLLTIAVAVLMPLAGRWVRWLEKRRRPPGDG